MLETGARLRVLVKPSAQGMRDPLAGDVVMGGPQASGGDHQCVCAGELAHHVRDLICVVAYTDGLADGEAYA